MYPPVESTRDRDCGDVISIPTVRKKRKGKLVQIDSKRINDKRKIDVTSIDESERPKSEKILYARYVCLFFCALLIFSAHKFPAKSETKELG